MEELSQSLIILNGKEFIRILRDIQHLMIVLQNLLKVQNVIDIANPLKIEGILLFFMEHY